MRIYVAHSSGFDYKEELYRKLKCIGCDFIFPHAAENENKDSRELIKKCDAVLAEVSYPSTGMGIELGRAEMLGIPIIAIFKKDMKISTSIRFVTDQVCEYVDLKSELSMILGKINMAIRKK